MTGFAVRGHMGFVPKDGERFDHRLNVRLHRDVIEQIDALKRSGDSRADFIRAAIDERVGKFSGLTPHVARTLAAHLIAFADSQETENEG